MGLLERIPWGWLRMWLFWVSSESGKNLPTFFYVNDGTREIVAVAVALKPVGLGWES